MSFLPRIHSTLIRLSIGCLLLLSVSSCRDQGESGGSGDPGELEFPATPNIVLIVADDLGWNDVGCYFTESGQNGREKIETPALDAMAADGVRFTNFYTASPVCTAARASILTGCYPTRVGMGDPDPERGDVIFPQSDVGLSHAETTIAESLKPAGYASAMIGKWHLGRDTFEPHHQGFDLYYGPRSRSRREPFAAVRRGDKVVEAIPHAELTRRYTEEAITFIRDHAEGPFFVYLAHSMPHTPLAASEAFLGKSARGLYGDTVAEIDWSTGEILRALEEAGLRDNTLVMFTSDNGPASHLHALGGDAYPFQGGKGRTTEGGVRMPCIATWSGVIEPGQISDVLWSTLDLLPTFARFAGVPGPALEIDGVDAAPTLIGKAAAEGTERPYFYYHREDLEAVRIGKWKLVFQHRRYDTVQFEKLRTAALYDLEADISESLNVQTRHPEVVERLKRAAAAMASELGDAKTGTSGAGQRPIGRLDASDERSGRGG